MAINRSLSAWISLAGLIPLSPAVAENSLQTAGTPENASPTAPAEHPAPSVQGEGKTLPAGVMRTRVPIKFAYGTKAFSGSGTAEESGFNISAGISAFVAEYGFRDGISLQMIVPFVFRNQMTLDGAAFQRSALFREKYDEFVAKASERLVSDGLCSSVAACTEAINSGGLALPYKTELVLPTGEKMFVNAGVPLKQIAESLVTRAAIPAAGQTGLGDVEAGALIALADPQSGLVWKDLPVNISVGAGLRFPTGFFADVPAAARSTGRGTLDLGLRANADWLPRSGIVLSFQNQSEAMLLSGRKKRSSLLNSAQLNPADPKSTGADQQPNDGEFVRDGIRNIGFFKAAANAGLIRTELSPLQLSAQWKYDFDAAVKTSGVLSHPASQIQSVVAGVTADGLALKIPAQLEVEHELPVLGQRRSVAPRVLSATVRVYYRF